MATRESSSVGHYDRFRARGPSVNVLIVGAGLMGAQIGCEYALGGHEVVLVARDPTRVAERRELNLRLVAELGLADAATVEAARAQLTVGDGADPEGFDLVVESVPEDLELKVAVLAAAAVASPAAIIASNTSSLSITELGERIGAPSRTVGTHYWNPPLLMSPVEVVAGSGTEPEVVERVSALLRALGKRPVVVGDVPGFAWNRIQMAVLREAVWLVEHGVVSPGAIDEILTYGLGRRWSNIGFFKAIALGGVDTWQRTSANLLPKLSSETAVGDLVQWVTQDRQALAQAAARRDRGLARGLLEERRGDG
jgi:3-hydroxyacyl-CoA dehydrogenase